jgi:class 3 adenylate cyclase
MAVVYRPEGLEPAERFAARSGGWLRYVSSSVPIVAVVAVMVIVGAIATYIHNSNRRGAVSLSNDLLAAIDQRIAVQMGAFLASAEHFLDAARTIGGARGVFDGGRDTEAFALRALPGVPMVAGYSYGDPEGNFQFLIRNADGGYDTKLIDRRGGGHHVTWTRRNAAGEVMGTTPDPSDTFDPRVRPWYRGVEAGGTRFWTEAYQFFTLRRPGITYSLPHLDANGRLVAVSAVDIELSTLSTFLKQLSIGINGKALVVDKDGRVVAYPSDDWLHAYGKDGALPRLDELGDAVLTRVYSHLRVEGYGRKLLDVADRRIIVSSGPLAELTGRDWTVLIVVPESDFVGFVANSGWIALALSGLVFLIMAGLAGQVMWRGIKAGRRDRAANLRQSALEEHAQTFAELAAAPDLIDRTTDQGIRHATERASETCRAKRVGVWYLTPDGRTFVCENCFDRVSNAHASGIELHRDELPNLFEALATGNSVDAPDAAQDRRTAELAAVYLEPLGIVGVHIAPIRSGERLLGMVMVEDPRRGSRAAGLGEFCGAMACLLALRFLPGNRPASNAPAAQPSLDPRVIAQQKLDEALAERHIALERTLLRYSASLSELAAGRIELAAVAVVRLPEWLSAAQRISDVERGSRMDAAVDAVRRIIDGSGVAYATLFDDQVVIAAFSGNPDSIVADARVVALAAIKVRDALVDLTSGWGEGSEFRIAIDTGPIMASALDSGSSARNLWGGAIGVAKVLAASGGRRAITVSEATYRVLSGDFLLRPRGTYFLPETGRMRTFVLVGAL